MSKEELQISEDLASLVELVEKSLSELSQFTIESDKKLANKLQKLETTITAQDNLIKQIA